jgi:hypothetical protein
MLGEVVAKVVVQGWYKRYRVERRASTGQPEANFPACELMECGTSDVSTCYPGLYLHYIDFRLFQRRGRRLTGYQGKQE